MRHQRSISKLHLILWSIFLSGNLLLILGDGLFHLPVVLSAFILFLLLVVGLVLFIIYRSVVAQWRAVLFFLLLYSLARWLAVDVYQHQWILLETVTMAIALYAMFALWGSLIALAIARDVSVAYLVIFVILAPMAMRIALQQAGGVLALLEANAPGSSSHTFSFVESMMLGLSCLPPLALLTFLPHFLWLWFKEWKRSPL